MQRWPQSFGKFAMKNIMSQKRKASTHGKECEEGGAVQNIATLGKVNVKNENTKVSKLSPNQYYDEVLQMKAREPHWNDVLSAKFKGNREEAMSHLYSEATKLVSKYAWAIPDEKAIDIISNFTPVIEIGCGKGYWASLLLNKGVDIIAFDKYYKKQQSKEYHIQNPSILNKGGPEQLSKHINRNLFLCYPDESESMAIQCLELFQGEYIIHVGELIMTNSTKMGIPVAPFGRTSSAEFQVSLFESFHCILIHKLELNYPFANDYLTIWKRTKFVIACEITSLANVNSGNEETATSTKNTSKSEKPKKKAKTEKPSNDAVEFINIKDLQMLREAALDMQYAEAGEGEESKWQSIPDDEVLNMNCAAPCLAHLL